MWVRPLRPTKAIEIDRQNRAGQAKCKSTSSQQVILNRNERVFRRGFLPNVGNLLAFEATARHGSVSRAAEELNLTQSAVSRQIQQLEESLGVSLFSRSRQGSCSPMWDACASQVRTTLSELSDATHQAIALSGASGVLNLATLPTFGTRWLIPRIPDFFARHPGATVNFGVRLVPFDFTAEPFDAAIHPRRAALARRRVRIAAHGGGGPVCSPAYRQRENLLRRGT